MKLIAVIVWILALAFSNSAANAFNAQKSFSAKEVRAELRQVQKLLRKVHPNLYAHRSVKKVRRLFKEIEKEIEPTMKLTSVAALVQKTLAVACDEHTYIDYNEARKSVPRNKRLFYRPLIITPDQVWANKSLWSDTLLDLTVLWSGSNVIDPSDLSKNVRSLISADGCLDDKPVFSDLQTIDTHLFLNNELNIERGLNLVGKNEKGIHKTVHSIQELSLQGLHSKISRIKFRAPHISLLELGVNPYDPGFWSLHKSNHPGIIAQHDQQNRASYIYVREFKGGKTAAKAIDKAMREVIKRNPEHVIVDLTTSPGGAVDTASRLLSYFLSRSHQVASKVYRNSRHTIIDKSFKAESKQRLASIRRLNRQFKRVKRRRGRYTLDVRRRSFGHPHYRGKVTVLVSPLTHSAATMTALILKKNRKAKIIGYQNAGSTRTSCFAPGGVYVLAKTKLKLRIPDTCYRRAGTSRKRSSHLVPDIEIDPFAQSASNLIYAIQEAAVKDVLKSVSKKQP